MVTITLDLDDDVLDRVASAARARHVTVEQLLGDQAREIAMSEVLHNPAHRKLMDPLVNPVMHDSPRDRAHDRDLARAEVYAASRERLLALIDQTGGDMGKQGWNRQGLYDR
jgi:hypothetical protein